MRCVEPRVPTRSGYGSDASNAGTFVTLCDRERGDVVGDNDGGG